METFFFFSSVSRRRMNFNTVELEVVVEEVNTFSAKQRNSKNIRYN